MLNMSIITACIPCIKRVLTDLSGGITVVAISEPLELTAKRSDDDRLSSSAKKQSQSTGLFSPLLSRSRASLHRKSIGSRGRSVPGRDEDEYSKKPDFQPDWATRCRPVIERSESVKGLRQNIIVQTIDYEVNVESDPSSSRVDDRDRSLGSVHDRSESAASH